MSTNFEPRDGLTDRIHALGALPVDPAVQSQHLTAMAEAAAAPSLLGTLGSRLRLAGALVVGFMLGTTGLASAGALGPLQPIASSAIEAATPLNVPNGKQGAGEDAGTARFRGDGAQACEDVVYRNHGQYIKGVRAKYADAADLEAKLTAAKESDCGKPLASLDGEPEGDTEAAKEAKEANANKGAKSSNGKGKSGGAAGDDTAKVEGDETPGKAEAECAGGADNGNAGGLKDEKAGDGAANADDEPAKPAAEEVAKPECADDAGAQGAEASDGAGKPADPGAQADEHTATTPAADAPAIVPAAPPGS